MSDHERIWLQNPTDANDTEGRMWCQDKVWPESPEDGEPTEYVRADLYDALVKERDALKLDVESWKNSAFLSDCEAQSGLLEDMTERAEAAEAKAAAMADEVGRLRRAAERVVWFDWSDNDADAVATIDALRRALLDQAKEQDDAQADK